MPLVAEKVKKDAGNLRLQIFRQLNFFNHYDELDTVRMEHHIIACLEELHQAWNSKDATKKTTTGRDDDDNTSNDDEDVDHHHRTEVQEKQVLEFVQSLKEYGKIFESLSGSGIHVSPLNKESPKVFSPSVWVQKKEKKKEKQNLIKDGSVIERKRKKMKKDKHFDMSRYHQRSIALQLQYEGGNYFGFAAQVGAAEETVEKHLFEALLKLKLIESRQTCNYSRCGRTDRGVSALGQVVGLKVRSALPASGLSVVTSLVRGGNGSVTSIPSSNSNMKAKHAEGNTYTDLESKSHLHDMDIVDIHRDVVPEQGVASESSISGAGGQGGTGTKSIMKNKDSQDRKEMDYCDMLNKVLPQDIRAIGWAEVTSDFSARFSATYRTYRYFFVKRNLDIEAMNTAAALLVGEHDFRNLCKMDVVMVSNFKREIYTAEIKAFRVDTEHPEKTIMMLEIKGIAFLWHMVRSIMAVLFMIGEGQEAPEILLELFDVDKHPRKPNYTMASELPLVLQDCGYDKLHIDMQPSVLWSLTTHFEMLWDRHTVAVARAENALQTLSMRKVNLIAAADFIRFTLNKRSGSTGKKGSSLTSRCSSNKEKESIESYLMQLPATIGNDGEKRVVWTDVLRVCKEQYDLYPSSCISPHIPLMKRNMGETYEERIAQLKGKNKDLYDRHISLQQSASERDPHFFLRMREQGSVL